MKNSKSKKILAVSLSALCIATSVPKLSVSAQLPPENNIVSPLFTYITAIDYSFKKTSSGFSCYGYTSIQSTNNAGVIVELQQKISGTWTTIKTWSHKSIHSATVEETYPLQSGTFRLKATHNAYNSSNRIVETVYSYSEEITN